MYERLRACNCFCFRPIFVKDKGWSTGQCRISRFIPVGASAGNATSRTVTAYPSAPSTLYKVTVTNLNGLFCDSFGQCYCNSTSYEYQSVVHPVSVLCLYQLTPSTGRCGLTNPSICLCQQRFGLVTGSGHRHPLPCIYSNFNRLFRSSYKPCFCSHSGNVLRSIYIYIYIYIYLQVLQGICNGDQTNICAYPSPVPKYGLLHQQPGCNYSTASGSATFTLSPGSNCTSPILPTPVTINIKPSTVFYRFSFNLCRRLYNHQPPSKWRRYLGKLQYGYSNNRKQRCRLWCCRRYSNLPVYRYSNRLSVNPSNPVTVNAKPVITLNDNDICVGETLQLTGSETGFWSSVNTNTGHCK